MSSSPLYELFSRSSQRMMLLEWMLLRAQFENNERRIQQLQHLQEQERIQCFGHLDFLQSKAPLIQKPLEGGDSDVEYFLDHIQKDLESLIPQSRQYFMENNQRDIEDWLNSVERQNQEFVMWIQEQLHPQHYTELKENPPPQEDVLHHFTERADRYDRSSHWCTDTVLKERVLEILQPQSNQVLLDVACGTGLVSAWFHKKHVQKVIGVDITEAMYVQAKDRLDEFFVGAGEALPFDDDSFDIVICRQGTQFMDDKVALREMYRVVKPNGVVCVINLCAYGEEDKEEYFEVLRLRNPVRRNFYLREDMLSLFQQAGFEDIVLHDHISNENVDIWSNNGAISEERREAIRNMYRNGSDAFLSHHRVQSKDENTNKNTFYDQMLFAIVVGKKQV